MRTYKSWLAIVLLVPCLTACGAKEGGGASAGQEEPPVPITNRIDVPPAVRKNLGITFADVGYRNVARTRRVPGRFELLPEAHRAYHASLAGNVELLVKQYQVVEKGDLLFRLDSPTWREMQLDMARTVNAIRRARSMLSSIEIRSKAVADHAARLEDERDVWEARLGELKDLATLGAGNKSARTSVRAQLAAVRTSSAEIVEEQATLRAEANALQAELDGHQESTPLLFSDACCEVPTSAEEGTHHPKDLALSRAAALLGVTVHYLRENAGTVERPRQRWREVEQIEVRARQAGVVEALHVTNGAWVEVGAVVLGTVETRLVRFRGSGLQADLATLTNGLAATVLPPGGSASDAAHSLAGTLTLGIEADPLTRKIDLIVVPFGKERPHWARDGVSTELEIVLQGTQQEQLAVPVSAVIQDGLDKVIFRRDPKDPNKVIRLKADLGLSDGRWVVVESGFVEGDQVVHHGVYELMLASGSEKQQGGHFHADGTFHAGSDH